MPGAGCTGGAGTAMVVVGLALTAVVVVAGTTLVVVAAADGGGGGGDGCVERRYSRSRSSRLIAVVVWSVRACRYHQVPPTAATRATAVITSIHRRLRIRSTSPVCRALTPSDVTVG